MSNEIIKLSQLDVANVLELTDDTQLIVITPDGATKRSTYGALKLNAGGITLKTKRLTLTPAEVKLLNTTPQAFGLTVPVGYAARVIAFDGYLKFQTKPYSTKGNLSIRCVGANSIQAGFTAAQFLSGTVDRRSTSTLTSAVGLTDDQLLNGADLEVYVTSGDPTDGDSDITLTVVYFEEQL